MAGINVKVSKAKLVKALEDKVKALTAEVEKSKKAQLKYEVDKKAWEKRVIAAASKSPRVDVDSNYRGEIIVRFIIDGGKFPEPKREFFACNEGVIREIENTIRILNLSDEETVNARTYEAVVRYL